MKYSDVRIEDIFVARYGKSLPKLKRKEGNVKVYGSGGVIGYHNKALVEGPAIILGRKGNIGKVFYEEDEFFPIDTTYYIEEDSSYDLKFIYYLLQTLNLDKLNTHSAVPGISRENLYRLNVSIPDKSRQTAIGKILTLFDRKIELNNDIVDTIEEIISAIFRRWFKDFEFPNSDNKPYRTNSGEFIESELGQIPIGWEISELSRLIKIKSGKRPVNTREKYNSEYSIPVVGATKIIGYTNEALVEGSIITTGRVGTHGCISRYDQPIWISDNAFYIRSEYEEYIYQVMNYIDYYSLNRGSTQPLISLNDLKKYPMLLPPIEIIKDYEERVCLLSREIDTYKKENMTLNYIKATIMPKLISGEIELPSYDKAIAFNY
ncbi:restriction endonuclease subunit S [Metaclostridioides mangenotii]|uniref:Type I restriction enzyme S subunit n=1 Tax=Metaclostridioides mangenotii TaxID=1540 RepID=A0ABS4EE39_9FIRM|nr:restriction endonuclease subunit S [Clostridioides mangenotii]MBP1856201.1 type I restriction enzyme S subunit [Clostridioides mangenotii]